MRSGTVRTMPQIFVVLQSSDPMPAVNLPSESSTNLHATSTACHRRPFGNSTRCDMRQACTVLSDLLSDTGAAASGSVVQRLPKQRYGTLANAGSHMLYTNILSHNVCAITPSEGHQFRGAAARRHTSVEPSLPTSSFPRKTAQRSHATAHASKPGTHCSMLATPQYR